VSGAIVTPENYAKLRALRRILVNIRASFRRADTQRKVTPAHGRGLCYLVDKAGEYEEDFHGELSGGFAAWPEWSGCTGYPVPDFGKYQFYNTKNKWSRHTLYGRARRRLLDWLIDVYLRDVR
jgi:hypothetical protein